MSKCIWRTDLTCDLYSDKLCVEWGCEDYDQEWTDEDAENALKEDMVEAGRTDVDEIFEDKIYG